MARTAVEQALLSGVNLHAGAEHSDSTFPYNFWVSPNGNDGAGNGSVFSPYATVRRAIRQAADGRGDRIIVGPGSYAETVDIGAGSTAGGNTNGGYSKRNLQLLGDDSVFNGCVQIIGDGSTAQSTIRVQGGHLRGFVLKNMELDTNGVARPALELVTNDTGASPTATSSNYRFLVENVAVRSNDPSIGIYLAGASLGSFRKITIAGPTIGIGLDGSANNNPVDLDFEDLRFYDNVTADMATVASPTLPANIIGRTLTNVSVVRARFEDRGGTPVTNYINIPNGATYVNVGFYDCFFARDIADNTLMAIGIDVIVLGHSANGVESNIGS